MIFEKLLVSATVISGIIFLFDLVLLKKKRAAGVDEPILVEYARSFFPVFLIVLLLRSFLAEPFRIPSGSMKPTLLEGDLIVVNKFNYGLRLPITGTKLIPVSSPKRGDVIVFHHKESGKDLIKRVVALPGEHVEYKDKTLYLNGKPVEQKFLTSAVDIDVDGRGQWPVNQKSEKLVDMEHDIFVHPNGYTQKMYAFNNIVVPEGEYFVLGDNRDNSQDSRFWGFVKDKDILGRAFATWLSIDWLNKDIRWERFAKGIK
jgi:signal peptidase I